MIYALWSVFYPCTKGWESFFSVYRGILSFNIFLAPMVHYDLAEVEEHDFAELSHSMYSLLKAKAKLQLIFQQKEKKKFYSRLFPPKTLYQFVDLLMTNPNLQSFPATFLHFRRKSSWKSCCKAAFSQSLVTNLGKTPSSIDLGDNITLTN